MKLGILKNLLLENNIVKITVHSEFYVEPLIVLNAIFDKKTRNVIYLEVNTFLDKKANRLATIKSYLLDFKDTHTVLIRNLDRNKSIYSIEPSFEIDKNNNSLCLHASSVYKDFIS